MTVTATIPTAQPDNLPVQFLFATASSGEFTDQAAVDATAGIVTWTFTGAVAAGSSGQMSMVLRPPNYQIPNGDTLTVSVTAAAAGATTQTAQAASTVQATSELIVVKALANPEIPATLDEPVTCRVSAAQQGDLDATGSQTFSCGTAGRANLEDIVIADTLPPGRSSSRPPAAGPTTRPSAP